MDSSPVVRHTAPRSASRRVATFDDAEPVRAWDVLQIGTSAGHVDDGRHSAGGRGACGTLEVLELGSPRIARVDVGVDHARDHVLRRSIDRLGGLREMRVIGNENDRAVLHAQARAQHHPARDQRPADDPEIECHSPFPHNSQAHLGRRRGGPRVPPTRPVSSGLPELLPPGRPRLRWRRDTVGQQRISDPNAAESSWRLA
jgi:hypothetical protein